MTDSELVPWGKGEKNPDKGSERDLKSNAYKLSELLYYFGDAGKWRRTFCIMGQRVNMSSKLKPIGGGAVKASLNRAI